MSVVQPQGDATSREQNQTTEGAAVESKKVQGPDKPVREKKRSIFKKPIQMPGKGNVTECKPWYRMDYAVSHKKKLR